MRLAVGKFKPEELHAIARAAGARGMDVDQYLDTVLLEAAVQAIDAAVARDCRLAVTRTGGN